VEEIDVVLFALTMSSIIQTPAKYAQVARAHAIAGRVPVAVQRYHDALSVFPADRTLQRDLETIRDLVGYPPGTRPAPPSGLRHTVSDADVFRFAMLCGVVLAVGLAARLTTQPRWAGKAIVVGAVGFLLALGVFLNSRLTPAARPLIVATPTVVRGGNGPSYPPRLDAALPPGAEVDELLTRGGWVQVRLANGVIGWMPEAAFLR
jgi:hypothetical protein